MSLFGRPQDRLSHVLVSAPFESLSEFYFPPRKPRRLELSRENRYIHTSDAEVTLADIPFVRLRDDLQDSLLQDGMSYSEVIRQAQHDLGPPELVLDPATRRVRCGSKIVHLKPVNFAFLAWFARRAVNGEPGISRNNVTELETAQYLAEYKSLHDELSGEYERVAKAVGKIMENHYFDYHLSPLHKQLISALGKTGARPYLIESDGKRPHSRYALKLKPQQIHFADLDEEGENR
jgi:hypothetical protein